MTASVRVVLADQGLNRGVLRAVPDAADDIEVVSGPAAATAAAAHLADVVLRDVQMPGCDGIQGTAAVLRPRPQCRVPVLTTVDLDEYVFAAPRAVASWFLLRTTPPSEPAAAIRTCASATCSSPPTVTRRR